MSTEWLKYYLKQGYSLIPVADNKQPVISHKYGFLHGSHDATQDYERLKHFTNFGLVCNAGVTCIDIDLYKYVGEIPDRHARLLQTLQSYNVPAAVTPRNGLHLFISKIDNLKLNLLYTDIRNTNQYIVVSNGQNGYEWRTPLSHISRLPVIDIAVFAPYTNDCCTGRGNEFDRQQAVIPPVEPVTLTQETFEQVIHYLRRQPPAISGQDGHRTTMRVVSDLRVGFNLAEDVVKWLMMNIYNPTCQPEWSESEIDHKIADATCRVMPGYLWKQLGDARNMSYGSKLYRAVQYCNRINDVYRIITHCRIGFMLTEADTITYLKIRFPGMLMDNILLEAIRTPSNLRNQEVGYLLTDWRNV